MTESGADGTQFETRLATIETALDAAIESKLAGLGAELKARIEAKLSGGVLAKKSGALLASLTVEEEDDAVSAVMRVGSYGIAYARLHDFGGKTAAHEIVASKAKALAFVTSGKTSLAERVNHSGAQISRSLMNNALDDMHDEIVGELKTVVVQIIQTA